MATRKITEEWRKIPGFHKRYSVSNLCKIKTDEITVNYNDGRASYVRPSKILKCSLSSLRKYKTDRYLMIRLQTSGGNKMTTYMHRVIALAFVENPYNKPHVNHKDGDTLNNSLENLEWVTNRENIQHAHDNGLVNTAKGQYAPTAKITNEQALVICKSKLPYQKLAEKYGIGTSMVSGIKTGRYWSHLTGIEFKRTFYTKKHKKDEYRNAR